MRKKRISVTVGAGREDLSLWGRKRISVKVGEQENICQSGGGREYLSKWGRKRISVTVEEKENIFTVWGGTEYRHCWGQCRERQKYLSLWGGGRKLCLYIWKETENMSMTLLGL